MKEGCQSESRAFHSLTFECPSFPFLDCHNLWNEGEALCLQTQCTPNRSSAKPGQTCWEATSSRPWRSWRRRPSRPCRRRSSWELTARATRRRPSCSSWTSLLSSAETSMPSTPCSSATWTTTGTEAPGQGWPPMEGWYWVLLQAREGGHGCHHQCPHPPPASIPAVGPLRSTFLAQWFCMISGMATEEGWQQPLPPLCSSVTHSIQEILLTVCQALFERTGKNSTEKKMLAQGAFTLAREWGEQTINKALRHLQYTSLCTYIFTYTLYLPE